MKLLVYILLSLHSSVSFAQGALDDLRPRTTPETRVIYRKAISQCLELIRSRTGSNNRLSIFGPCGDKSGTWAAIQQTPSALRLTFFVSESEENNGTLWTAVRGKAVLVTCHAKLDGQVTSLEDRKAGISDARTMANGQCLPPGRDDSESGR